MRITKRLALAGVALAAATLCPACGGSSAKDSPGPLAAPHANWTGVDPPDGAGRGREGERRVHVPGRSATVFRTPTGASNGLGLDAQGRLIASEGIVLLVHGSLRLLWLLREMVAIVGADDHEAP
ncbi:MAG: hypothetical protein ACRDRA_12175 [Pseudonocardiaceae bacterium]